MDSGAWQAVIGVGGMLTGGGVVGLLRVRGLRRRDNAEAGEHEANSAEVLAKAYSVLVDDLRKDLDRQDGEIKELRAELRTVIATKDQEIAAVRLELASERTESGRLRQRVAELEARVLKLNVRPGGRRAADPPAPAA